MLICHCQVVRERDIRRTVQLGARTVGAVGRACGAGTTCGGCVPAIRAVIVDEVTQTAAAPEPQVYVDAAE